MKCFFILSFLLIPVVHADLEKRSIVLDGHRIQVEVAANDNDRSKGLMFRKELRDGQGMLFIFDQESPRSFWMKNTFIPLSIGFFNKDRVLVDIQDMEPVKSEMETNLPAYESRHPAKYALEVPRGWFFKNKIKPGAKFTLQ